MDTGILTPSFSQSHSAGISNISGQSDGQLGTLIDPTGKVTVNVVVDDPNIPFLAIRDTVRFLSSLFPGWSLPAFVGGVSIPNEVGATYSLEKMEKKVQDFYDGAEQEVKIYRKLSLIIREILDEATVKRVQFEVKATVQSDIHDDLFRPITFINAEIKPFRRENGRFHLCISMDGGPPEVKMKTNCFGCTSSKSLRMQETAVEMKPYIYQQGDSVIRYIREFNPNDVVARNVASHNQVYRSSFDDEQQSQRSGSKVSQPSKVRFPNKKVSRADSKGNYESMISGGSHTAADEIRKLYELLNVGALTKEEFESEKRKLLSARNTTPEVPPGLNGLGGGSVRSANFF